MTLVEVKQYELFDALYVRTCYVSSTQIEMKEEIYSRSTTLHRPPAMAVHDILLEWA